MIRPRSLLVPAVVCSSLGWLGSLGCGAEPPPTAASAAQLSEPEEVLVEPGDRAGASRGELEPVGVAGETGATTGGGAGEARAIPRPLVTLTTLLDLEAEDGAGGLARVRRATGIDLDARRFPVRALDPVLELGALRLRHYSYPAPGVLRYVLSDDALPPDGTPMFVQYGQDADSRTALGTFERSAIVTVLP